jgi:excinuclease ABC subunit C
MESEFTSQSIVHLEDRLKRLPSRPGVYLMKVSPDTVIYVGKAKNLKNRVKSYFKTLTDSSLKSQILRSQTSDIEWIITDTEKEALILESNLIKKYRPKYNVVLKDDKSYPYLRLSLGEQFPRLSVCRKVRRDGSLYFGPYVSAQAARETWRLIHRVFPIRKCQTKGFQIRKRPCVNYQIGQCPAPCCHFIDQDEYRNVIREIQLFLQGKSQELIRELQGKMEQKSQALHFEAAARIRDQILALEKTLEQQKISSPFAIDQDVIGYYREGRAVEIVILFIRDGKMVGSKNFSLKAFEALKDPEIISSFINQFYRADKFLPSEVLVPLEIEDRGITESWLSERKGGNVRIVFPRKGHRLDLIHMATQNAVNSLRSRKEVSGLGIQILEHLKEKLHLSHVPSRMECFDNSNLFGRFAVGSMVRFEDGEPRKERYRRFRIRTVNQIDDYGMMYEVLKRRITRGMAEGDLPDLIMIDGGKGHLQVALKVIDELKMSGIDTIALAKGEKGKEGRQDKIFLPHRKNPVILSPGSPLLSLLQRIRDESHRFALRYHHTLKKKGEFHSLLDEIPGVGEKTKKRLLTHFGSLQGIRGASIEEIAKLPGLTPAKAEIISRYVKLQEI